MRRICLLFAVVPIALACGDLKTPPVANQVLLPDSAEQLLIGVRFQLTDNGVRRGDVVADTMLTYGDNTRLELRHVTTTFFSLTGEKNATLTSREGTHNVRVQSMEARGNVIVITTDGKKLTTEQLRYDPQRNEVSSDSAFTLTEAERITQGVGFISDPDMKNIRVLKGAKSSGQAITIPKR